MFEEISEKLEDKTEWGIFIGKTKKEDRNKYKAKYYIGIWFNDMFGWAYSHGMSFVCPNKKIDELVDKFNEWFNLDGIKFKELFNKVPYPKRDDKKGYSQKELDFYFNENTIIGNKLAISINNFCGFELNEKI
jgi:hypothetical protein